MINELLLYAKPKRNERTSRDKKDPINKKKKWVEKILDMSSQSYQKKIVERSAFSKGRNSN